MIKTFTRAYKFKCCVLILFFLFAANVSQAQVCDAQFSYYGISNPDSVHFYPTGTAATSYYWDFGDGTSSTQQYPWHLFSGPGTYNVCLTINVSGIYCTSCDSVTINGSVLCDASFTYYSVNNPDSLHFNPNTTGATSYYWNFGDGTTSTLLNPWHLFTAPGAYNVCLTINVSGTYCTWCDSVTVTGTTSCNAQFVHYSVNNPDSVHFYPNTTNASGYYWDFGDGTTSNLLNPWHVFSGPGTYNVCLTINVSGIYCTWCDSVTVTGTTSCNAQFVHYSVNNPDSVHFYPNTTNASGYYWDFGDGSTSNLLNPWHVFSAPGTYNVCLTINVSGTYCTWCDSVTVVGSTTCNTQFAYYSLNNPDSIHFYPTGTAATSYYWNFGDGTSSTLQYPWHYYTAPGTYYVCLTTNVSGFYCTWCDSVTVVGTTICNASFVHYSVNNPDSVHFYPNTTGASGYYWNFGDGTTSTLLNPWHLFTAPGTYNVCLTINVSGTYCTWCDSVVVPGIVSCNAQFSYYSISNPDSLHFYTIGTGATSYYWDFGDGTNSTQQYPWHLFNNPGTYYVCLTANYSGTYCTWCDSVIVSGSSTCNTQFSYYYMNNPDSVHFYPTGSSGSSYYWSFGDGTSSTQIYPWHLYASSGTYYVCLTVNQAGMYCTWCDSVMVSDSNLFHHLAYNPALDMFEFDILTGVPEIISGNANAGIYPNPVNDYLIVLLQNVSKPVEIKIFDVSSRIIYNRNNLRNGQNNIDTKGISSGLYFYTIALQGQMLAKGKIVIRH